jgi:hypothetical protein
MWSADRRRTTSTFGFPYKEEVGGFETLSAPPKNARTEIRSARAEAPLPARGPRDKP